ncbi:MAG: DUF1282 family protein [Marinobacter sp.]|uniref:Yip1 family protein n=1 Tax=Marinobacter sp. TaxID=50741 RepID=UPI001B77ABB7|nr:Yip1 family protein [Marinobacter sp.]MBQ0815957.1 DUF1282 family protein [Marinobacter sp.]|tara:strand:- start:26 stop:589 length:564 start_codon:yes stop_codon:yes gene_type:complete
MNVSSLLKLPFSSNGGWGELQRRQLSIPMLAWFIVVPMSLLPPVMLYYAGTHYGDDFIAGFAGKEWRFITTILFLAELLTFFVMGWLIHAVAESHKLEVSYNNAYLLAAIAPLPLWLSSLALLVPSVAFSVIVVLAAMALSCTLVYQGLRSVCGRTQDDVLTMSATYTIMAASLLAWVLLLAMVWAY